jgi:hypothetical protein
LRFIQELGAPCRLFTVVGVCLCRNIYKYNRQQLAVLKTKSDTRQAAAADWSQ